MILRVFIGFAKLRFELNQMHHDMIMAVGSRPYRRETNQMILVITRY